jgi:hypothetical protein
VRPVAPQPVAAPRKLVRIFITCTVGARKVRFGPGRLGVRKGARLSCKGRTAPALRKAQLEVQRFAARGGWRRVGKVKTTTGAASASRCGCGPWATGTVRSAYGGNAALLPAGSLGAKLVVAPRR